MLLGNNFSSTSWNNNDQPSLQFTLNQNRSDIILNHVPEFAQRCANCPRIVLGYLVAKAMMAFQLFRPTGKAVKDL